MSFTHNTLKHSCHTILISSIVLFTGCSSKPERISTNKINNIYKYNPDPNIRNSKAMHRATLRPYEVFGVTYYPKIANVGDTFRGIASWYGPNFHAKKTSNGETYNMYAMTAAHKTLPMNTMLKVVNLENGKNIIVRVNDRGPFVDERIIDLSNTAARKIDMVRKGTARVAITVLGYNAQIQNNKAPVAQMPKTILAQKTTQKRVKEENIEIIEPIDIKEKTLINDNYSIQVGAFRRLEGAKITQNKYISKLYSKRKVIIKKVTRNSQILYKVLINGFSSYNEAQSFKNLKGFDGAVVIGNK